MQDLIALFSKCLANDDGATFAMFHTGVPD